MKRRTLEVEPGQPLTLAPFLSHALPTTEAMALVQRGAVYVDGRRCTDGAAAVRVGQKVSVVLSESGQSALSTAAPTLEPIVLHEAASFLVLAKPAGMTTQPTPSRLGDSLWDWAKARFGSEVGLVHRLDRETSGVIVLGKGRAATGALATQFRLRTVQKTYLAVVGQAEGQELPERGACDLPLSRDPTRPGRFRASGRANGLSAHTDFERRFRTERCAGVALFPRTGRTHQLRAHLSALGFPIAGDALYGGALVLDGVPVPRCLLHAAELSLQDPVQGTALTFSAPLPQDLKKFWLA